MKALVLNGINESLTLKETQKPVLSAGEVLINIKAASFNRRDYWIKKGQYAGLKFPIILGSDGAGVVAEVFNDEHKHWIGESVVINPSLNWGDSSDYQGADFSILGLPQDGTFAEFVKVPASQVYKKPAHLNYNEAAGFPLAGLTAFRALFHKAKLKPGENVLVVGAGAGTSTFAIQFALAAKANVYVTSGSNEKIEKAIALGAKGGVNYKDENWDEQLLALAGGFDVIIDSALGEGFARHLHYVNRGARIVFFGGTAGNLPALNARIIFWKQVQIYGTTMGTIQDFEAMLQFIEKHQLYPVIDSVYKLEEGDTAIQLMENSEQFGKIVLELGN